MSEAMHTLLMILIVIWTVIGVFYVFVGIRLLWWLDRKPVNGQRYTSSADAQEDSLLSKAEPAFDATKINEMLDKNRAERENKHSEGRIEVHEGNLCEEVMLDNTPINRTSRGR